MALDVCSFLSVVCSLVLHLKGMRQPCTGEDGQIGLGLETREDKEPKSEEREKKVRV